MYSFKDISFKIKKKLIYHLIKLILIFYITVKKIYGIFLKILAIFKLYRLHQQKNSI